MTSPLAPSRLLMEITMIECDCKDWAVSDMQALMLGNGHNPNCERFVSGAGAVALLKELVEGIKFWASQEDGVPEELWEAYKKAVFIVSGKMLADDQEQ